MRKLTKGVSSVLMAAVMTLSLPAAGLTVHADALSDAAPEDVYVSF